METIIENRWAKYINGQRKECRVYWHYEQHLLPRVAVRGYNPFPFITGTGLPSNREIFENWMIENGWNKEYQTTDIFSRVRK